ncbi:MAG: hypothetical protein HYX89_05400 [Chloroflexi bacterium]|nr:hypothetical protein [Chloroflexota bacterium]
MSEAMELRPTRPERGRAGRKWRLAVAAGLLFAFALASPVYADPSVEYPLQDAEGRLVGHFYAQTNGAPVGNSSVGFAITDEQGVAFWRAYEALGGPEVLGYPITGRFEWNGRVTQLTQRAALQWWPDQGQVLLMNLVDLLGEAGKDQWLAEQQGVPARSLWYDPPRSPDDWARLLAQTKTVLANAPGIAQLYFNSSDPLTTYGLPTSGVEDRGDFLVVRFQRAVIQQWKRSVPWADKGQATVANSGIWLRDAGLLQASIFVAQALPAGLVHPDGAQASAQANPSEPTRVVVEVLEGKATWYGAAFQGRRMSNGEPFDMYDPTIAAVNRFPLGTMLRVTDRQSGNSVEVVVKDRGAFIAPYLVDLSYAAFAQLAPPSRGVLNVTVEVLSETSS